MVRKEINVLVHVLNLKFLEANKLEIPSKQWNIDLEFGREMNVAAKAMGIKENAQ